MLTNEDYEKMAERANKMMDGPERDALMSILKNRNGLESRTYYSTVEEMLADYVDNRIYNETNVPPIPERTTYRW